MTQQCNCIVLLAVSIVHVIGYLLQCYADTLLFILIELILCVFSYLALGDSVTVDNS